VFFENYDFVFKDYIEKYVELSSEVNRVVNLATKYNINHQKSGIKRLYQVKIDKKVLSELIEHIKQKS